MFVQRWLARASLNPGAGDVRAIDAAGNSCVTGIVQAPRKYYPCVDDRIMDVAYD